VIYLYLDRYSGKGPITAPAHHEPDAAPAPAE
jgi:hypothetical protein